ncbi:MAG: bifunctional diaminohydroxyphosphoribosylaminopyrimidine deaminase/5-amino-6-(5-phosphoribosylamino)uracil reductase RibD [Firmicutes bacterium]|nr:bifunctional diaminohydroxyphosphoribosylaminopyrimidine deaminase/5-amino-6-(5-phosphoribosylamino)uracil reductase RibD [Bacillota bacterium]
MDEKYMRRAIELAKKGAGFVSPNPMVGAVVVRDGRIISEGCHERYGGYHAERNALLSCNENTEGADMYVTLEPCCHHGKTPPCTDIIIEKRIKRVFVGSDDPNPLVAGKGYKILRENGIEVITGVLKKECDEINRIFFHYIKTKTPYITMKYAMSADGKIACKTGDSKWVSNEKSREIVQRLRYEYTAIMAGIGTVIADNPRLTCRENNAPPLTRIICDTDLRIPLDCNIVKTARLHRTIIAAANNGEKAEKLREMGAEILLVPKSESGIDLNALVSLLGEMGIDSILLEGGGTLNEAALKSGIVNEIKVFTAPKIIGGKDAPSPVGGAGAEKMSGAARLKLRNVQMIDDDILAEYDVIKEN